MNDEAAHHGRPASASSRHLAEHDSSAGRTRLASLLGPTLFEAIESYVDERIAEVARETSPANGALEWLSLRQAARDLDCTPDAVRMRVRRGRLEGRHQGRRLYVSRRSVDGTE